MGKIYHPNCGKKEHDGPYECDKQAWSYQANVPGQASNQLG